MNRSVLSRAVFAIHSRRCWSCRRPICWIAVAVAAMHVAANAEDGRCRAEELQRAHLPAPPEMASISDVTAVIDQLVAARWREEGVQPTPLCDDAAFARRAYLDLIGCIPSTNQWQAFAADTTPDKRARLVEQLVASDGFAEHFADLFDVMLMGRARADVMAQRQQHGWRQYLVDSFQQNRPWNEMARDMVLARETDQTDVRASWYLYERRDRHQEIAEAVAPGLFGIRIECAQCHDHPLASEIYQSHYWGLVAFFNRSKNQRTDHGPRVTEVATGGFQKFTDLAGDSYDAELTFFASKTVPEQRLPDDAEESDSLYVNLAEGEPRVPKFSRREQFADQILTDHPLLARAIVNRVWGLLLGRGIVHPVDRMDSMHDPSHPELLDWLSQDFQEHNYDIKRLVTVIANTRCYQLSSQGMQDTRHPEWFAYGLTKPLPAESIVRSIGAVLCQQPCEPDAALLSEFRAAFPDVLPEEPTTALAAALMLTNHGGWNDFLRSEQATAVKRWASMDDLAARVDAIFLSALSRLPDGEERRQAVAYLQQHEDALTGTSQLVWCVLTSAEFCFR